MRNKVAKRLRKAAPPKDHSGYGSTPVIDVRTNDNNRSKVDRITKANNGNQSKYVPGKWGYGTNGPKKY